MLQIEVGIFPFFYQPGQCLVLKIHDSSALLAYILHMFGRVGQDLIFGGKVSALPLLAAQYLRFHE